MGRIVIPRPRLERRGYQPKYRRQQTLDRRHKFGPDDIKLLMKVLDTAVAVGGKVAGAVGRTQDGPDAARARQLVADRKAREQGGVSPSSTAEAGKQLASPDKPAQVQAFDAYVEGMDEPAEYAPGHQWVAGPETRTDLDPSVWGPSPRTGRSPIPGGRPPTPSPETVDDENLFAAGFNEGTTIREGMERARQEARRARQQGAGGFAGLPQREQQPITGSTFQSGLKIFESAERVGAGGGDPRPMYAQAKNLFERALSQISETGGYNAPIIEYVALSEERLGNPGRAAELRAWTAAEESRRAAPQRVVAAPAPRQAVVAPAAPQMVTATVPGPPAAADPPTPAARPAQVEVLVDQAVMMPPGQVHASLANDSLMTAQALVAAAQANREAMWPSVAELQRMDVGALQALGAYADTPQKRAQIMQAIRDSPDVQPTSVSDLLGMGEDHVRRAQKKALAVMKGSSKGGGLGLKDTVALAKSMYGMRIDEGKARRASDLHPGKLTLQQQDIEAGRRKALLEDRTRDAVVRQKLAAARKAEAEATKRERDAERALKRAKSRGGATYKRGVEDKAVEDRVNAKLRIEALKAEGKTPPPKLVAAAGPLADASNAEVFRYYDTHFQGRKGAANRSVKLGRAFSHLPKPPRTPSEGSVPWGARKELLRLDRVYTFYETALLNKDSQAAKDITAELGRPPTQVDLANIRNERAELSAEIDKLRQRGRAPVRTQQKDAPIDVKNMTDEELRAMEAGQ
jgi:hypothetical protein